MQDGQKIAAILLIVLGVVVFLYGLLDLSYGGSVGPLGIGVVGAGLGYILLRRGSDDEDE